MRKEKELSAVSDLEIALLIERVAFGGKGVGRLPSGKVCFVPYVIPGERVLVRIEKERSSFAEATLIRVLEASPLRVKAPCPVFGRCGGCHYQHITYARQLSLKQEQVADTLRRLGGVADADVRATMPSPLEYHYRNRITVHVKGGRTGFYSEGSRTVVEIAQCPIASPAVNGMLAELRQSKPRDGEYPLREAGSFRGFRQINNAAAAHLQSIVAEMAAPGGTLLVDAYCGAGFFAKALKEMFRMVAGIEWSADAVRAARVKAGETERYFLGDVGMHIATALALAPAEQTTLLLDPPSEGVDPEVLRLIGENPPQRLIYVSCNPSTLARDIKRLAASHRLKTAAPVDMFPQTAEIEVVALLEKL